MKYATTNGWTKKKMIAHIKKNFKGQSVEIRKLDVDQGRFEDDFVCLYRGPKGKQCAIGMFIPDELYDSSMEENNAEAIVKLNPELLSVIPLENLYALSVLQGVHDNGFKKASKAVLLKRMVDWIKQNVK